MKCDIGDTLDGVKKIEDRSGDASTDSNSSRNPFLINWENKEGGYDHEESCFLSETAFIRIESGAFHECILHDQTKKNIFFTFPGMND